MRTIKALFVLIGLFITFVVGTASAATLSQCPSSLPANVYVGQRLSIESAGAVINNVAITTPSKNGKGARQLNSGGKLLSAGKGKVELLNRKGTEFLFKKTGVFRIAAYGTIPKVSPQYNPKFPACRVRQDINVLAMPTLEGGPWLITSASSNQQTLTITQPFFGHAYTNGGNGIDKICFNDTCAKFEGSNPITLQIVSGQNTGKWIAWYTAGWSEEIPCDKIIFSGTAVSCDSMTNVVTYLTSTPTTPVCVAPQVLQNGTCVTPPPATPTCVAPQVLQNGSCVTPTPVCVAPQVLQGNACVTPVPTCTTGQVLVNNVCTTPPPVCTAPKVLQNGSCVDPTPGTGTVTAADRPVLSCINGTVSITLKVVGGKIPFIYDGKGGSSVDSSSVTGVRLNYGSLWDASAPTVSWNGSLVANGGTVTVSNIPVASQGTPSLITNAGLAWIGTGANPDGTPKDVILGSGVKLVIASDPNQNKFQFCGN